MALNVQGPYDLRDEAGISAIEYVLIAAGVSVVIFAAVISHGANLTAMKR